MPTRLARRSALPLLLLSLLLSGCAGGPPRPGYGGNNAPPLQEQLSGKETVVYLVPKSPDIIAGEQWSSPTWRGNEYHEALRGVIFPAFDNTDTARTKITNCPEYDAATTTLVCQRVRMVSPGLTRDYSIVRYKLEVLAVEKPDRYELTLTPKLREVRNYKDLLLSVEAPPFPESELLNFLSAGRIRFKMEVDSQYDKTSVSGNFTRLLGKGATPRSPVDAEKGRLIYRMKREGWRADLTVEIWPYRGGSKVAVTAVVDARIAPGTAGASRTIDFGKIMDEVRAEVEKIVKS